jgi:spore maturation protein SpmA
VLNAIFAALIVGAVMTGAYNGRMPEVSQALFDSAKDAANLALGLVGVMALWLGFMRVLRDAGIMTRIAHALTPIMRLLFPDIPKDHPALSAIILNMAANMLGLGNAATPFGLKAMQELQKLNPNKAVATDSMALFLAMNTAGIAVIPTGVMGLRASLNSADPGGILFPTVLATLCSTVTAIIVAKFLAKRRAFAFDRYTVNVPESDTEEATGGDLNAAAVDLELPPPPTLSKTGLALMAACALWIVFNIARELNGSDLPSGEVLKEILKWWFPPLLALTIVLIGMSARIKVYESVIEGAREGFEIVVRIIPYLVAILVAVGVFRASGALDFLLTWMAPVTSTIGFPAEALPMALMRPLSGQGASGIMMETMQTYGPDSFVGYLVSVISGSTETTFYVLAVYFGSIGIRVTRHTVIACLSADLIGILSSLFWCKIFFT